MTRQWLYRLSTLPPMVYQGAIDRLIRGGTVYGVARWVMFFEFLGNPPRDSRKRLVLEVVEQLDNTIKAVQDKAIAWQAPQGGGQAGRASAAAQAISGAPEAHGGRRLITADLAKWVL